MDEYYRILSEQQARKKAKIVILDTGVDGTHEDLDDNFTSIETKYDTDPHGHGTHCAGIAAGVTNNGLGIGSLAGTNDESPFVEVSSVKVLSASGMGTQKTIIAGIIEAADEGADVISLSLGGRSNQSSQRAYSAAVEYAHRAGAIVVAAAGNSNRNAKDFAPANAEGIITVAAIDEHLLRAPFSNRTEDIEMAIAAPGVGIYSTVPGNQYKKYSGTSMACPFVAGLLGVMKSLEPELDHRTAYRMLHDTGLTTSETRVTGRIVQPADALAALVR
jgi:thermitase